ncbi:MAG: di-trans,poly-cis-decaprenylcistransferase [Desulfohalobiaceae bacterium]|nr:di-trans,poly-cis-decaprenylcistransferase [Desulfohalobiaceae bacterium]
MDGNGRWAKQRGLPRSEGHKAGTEAARGIVTRCAELGIEHLTLYTFSKENWRRPSEEVDFLFDLLIRFIRGEQQRLIDESIRLNLIGEPGGLPAGVRHVLQRVCNKTAKGEKMSLNLALNYSGRDEILAACRLIASQGLDPDRIDERLFASYLSTGDMPDPDLIIRTSGERRLSNFLLFQSAYSEFYFSDTLWPDYGAADLDLALEDFRCRCRRFGGVSEE